MGMLRHEPSKQVQTSNLTINKVIIFDWDDTLLCTSYLGAFGSEDLPSIVIMALEELDKQVVIKSNDLGKSTKKSIIIWFSIRCDECR